MITSASQAIAGDHIIVTAFEASLSDDYTAAGAAYVFLRNGDFWTQQVSPSVSQPVSQPTSRTVLPVAPWRGPEMPNHFQCPLRFLL